MAIGWTNESKRPVGTTFGENNSAVTSKNTRRYGSQESKSDFPESSTGENPAKLETRELPPSAPSHSNPKRLPNGGVVKTVGHATDASGRYLKPDYAKTTHAHGSDGFHDVRTDGASGQMHYPEAAFGKPTQRPAAAKPTRTTRQDAGALAGNPGDRTRYSGGKGRV
jgi:hypothetical protein